MMSKKEFLNTGLLEQYVLGLTESEESQIVEQHLDLYPELRNEVFSMQNALEEYAKQYAIATPSGLKSNILNEIDRLDDFSEGGHHISDNSSRMGYSWSTWVGYAALALITLGYFYQTNRLKSTQDKLEYQVAALETCNDNIAELEKSQAIYAFLSMPSTQAVTLSGTANAPQASSWVYWNEEEQNAYVNLGSLPQPPQDKQYQIWADVEGKMISVGLLDEQRTELQQISYIANAESLNVTLEPIGGSEEPTVSLLYVNGKVEGKG
ncbi:MAG: anti-sigma factor [Bacteroidota bacterium]